jgi:hypothetical protein
MTDKKVPVTVEALVPGVSAQQVFHAVVPIDLSLTFTGWGPLPALTGVKDQTGAWDHVGAHRRPQFSDGGEAFEEITSYDAPRYFDYQISGFTNAMKRFVARVKGSWLFTDTPAGTEIVWTYTFYPLPRRRLAVRFLAAVYVFYMRKAMRLTVQEVQRQTAAF